jgi:hypothetical protein
MSVSRPDCGQKLRRPDHRNHRFALGLFDNLRQLEIQTEEKIATVVLGTPEMKRIEQLVPVGNFSRTLIGSGNSLKFEKALMLQRAQKLKLCLQGIVKAPIQYSTVFHGFVNYFALSTIEVAGLAIQIRETRNLDLRLHAYYKAYETSVSKSSYLWEKLRFGLKVRIVVDPSIWVHGNGIMHSDDLLPAPPSYSNLSGTGSSQRRCRKLVDI